MHFTAEELLIGLGDDGNHRLPFQPVDMLCHSLCHGGIGVIAVIPLGLGNEVGGVVIVVQVAKYAATAHRKQDGQDSNLLFCELQGILCIHAGLGQSHAVGDWNHNAQKQGQRHRLEGEHKQILDDAGQRHGKGILLAAHIQGIVPHIDGCLDQHIHHDADGEPAEHDPDGADLGTVQEQGKNDAACHLCQHEGHEVNALRILQVAQNVRCHRADGGNHGAKDHGAQGIDNEGGIDFQAGGQGDGHQLHGNPQSNHQCSEHQNAGVFQLTGGIFPICLGKGIGIERFVFCLGHESFLLLM